MSFVGQFLCDVLDVDGVPDDEGRIVYSLSNVATVRCQLAPISTEERDKLRTVADVETSVMLGGTVSVNVRDWLRVHRADGPLVLRIEEIKHSGPSQRLLGSAVRTGNITDEERALGVIEPVLAGSEPLDGGTY